MLLLLPLFGNMKKIHSEVVPVPGSLSTATTLSIPSTSRAYLRALNPEADKAYEYT